MAKGASRSGSKEWIYGLHSVLALLKTDPGRVAEIRVLRGRQDQRLAKIRSLGQQQGVPVQQVDRDELDKLAAGNHQGVVALCAEGDIRDEGYLLELVANSDVPPLLLVLDGITDPHNLGACLRTADAAGVSAVVAPKDKSVGITATVRKVAVGAAEAVPFVVVTNLARTLRKLQDAGLWVVGTSGDAEQEIYDVDLKGPLALVLGAEGEGMRRLTTECCDVLVKLPMAGTVSSLNVSVASGVCLYEAVRQRRST